MKKNIADVNCKDKRCLVRVDFNVPLDDNKKVTDDNRIISALPTIKYLLENNAKVILMSHLGRPKGTVNMKYSLAPAAERLSQLLGKPVKLADDVVGDSAKKLVSQVKSGEVVMLENLRFHAEEEKNDPEFCKQLASFADVYVNDAFGTAHRAHASTAGISKYVDESVAGFLIEKELKFLGGALDNPQRPFVAILGGSKVSDKIGVIENLLNKVDCLLIGGGMAYTFFKAQGYEIGTSICESDKIDLAKSLLQKAKAKNVKMLLPVDTKVAKEFPNPIDAPIGVEVVDSDKIPADKMGLDIGEKTQKLYAETVKNAKTVVWNGPMGVFENPTLAQGTKAVAQALADNSGAVTIIGGGDSAAAAIQMGFADKISHISTGGGASLEFLEGLELPGIACLDNK
jgi:phosphoglycerate kinase